jgi:hypothetical protein
MLLPALAADIDTWFGGATSIVAGVTSDGDGGVTNTSVGQPELDARAAWGPLYARVDLDLHYDFATGEVTTPHSPEWALLQLSHEAMSIRGGVINPEIGVQTWDEWSNYFPTFATMFTYAQPGRILGGEPTYTLENGLQLFAFGGYDLDLEDYVGGAGVTTENDLWATWSALYAYPKGEYYGGFGAFELYPREDLWLTLDGGAGLMASSFFAGAQVIATYMPEAIVSPSVRVEGLLDPDDALGGEAEGVPTVSASLGARVNHEWAHFMVEGKASRVGDNLQPGVFFLVAIARPEPDDYSATYEEEEEGGAEGGDEAPAAPAAPAAAPEAPAAPAAPAPANGARLERRRAVARAAIPPSYARLSSFGTPLSGGGVR